MGNPKQSEYLEALNEYVANHGLRLDTVSFYTALNEESGESEETESHFGTCDITGIKGDVVECMGLDQDDQLIRFEAGTWLVHGILGKAAGAF